MTAFRDVRIIHASGQFDDTDPQALSDLKMVMRLRPHILCGTESGDDVRQARMRSMFDQHDYIAFVPNQTDGWVALRADWVGMSTVESRYDQVRPSAPELNDPHHYAGSGVIQMSFTDDELGKITVVGGGHYLTFGRTKKQAQRDQPGDPVNHVEWNKRLARAMGQACVTASKGGAISFFTADTNLADRVFDVFYGKPLLSCWDELDYHPNTGHGNIDVIASVNSDRRVQCKTADVMHIVDWNSDHLPIHATYRVNKLKGN